MKRHSNVIGTLSPHYGSAPITHPAVAQALRDADHDIAELRRRLATRTLALALLQNHPWVIIGRALGIVREVRHATQAASPTSSTPAADREAAAASPQAGLQQQGEVTAAAR